MNGIKKKYIAYIMIGTILIYGIVRYFNVVEGYIKNITKALIPFVVGAIMAYIINILMDAYEDLLLKKFHNKKIIRMISITLSFLTFMLVIALLLGIIIPQLVKISFSIMYTNPSDLKQIIVDIGNNEQINNILKMFNIDTNNIDIAGYMTRLIKEVMSGVGNVLSGIF